jgi:hypothetical protein
MYIINRYSNVYNFNMIHPFLKPMGQFQFVALLTNYKAYFTLRSQMNFFTCIMNRL